MPVLQDLASASQKFLQQILPMLVEQKFQRDYIDYNTKAWLENQLKGYEAYGEHQKKAMMDALRNTLYGEAASSLAAGAKKTPYPLNTFLEQGQGLFEASGIPAPAAPEVDKAAYDQTLVELAAAFKSGQPPSDDTFRRAAGLFGADTILDWVGQYSQDMRAAAENALREREVKVEEQLVPVRQTEAATSRGRLALDVATETNKPAEKQREEWLEFVKDVEDRLYSEGVKRDPATEAISALFSSGKSYDPLSRELRGQALDLLGQLRTKLIQRQGLSPGEIRFLQRVRNSAKINLPATQGGGLPRLDTGLTDVELTNNIIEAVTQLVMQNTGLGYEDAKKYAASYVGQLR